MQEEAGQELYCYRHLKFHNIPTVYYSKLNHSQSFSWQRKEGRRGRKDQNYICSYYLDVHIGCWEPTLWFSIFCIESRNSGDIFPFKGTTKTAGKKIHCFSQNQSLGWTEIAFRTGKWLFVKIRKKVYSSRMFQFLETFPYWENEQSENSYLPLEKTPFFIHVSVASFITIIKLFAL